MGFPAHPVSRALFAPAQPGPTGDARNQTTEWVTVGLDRGPGNQSRPMSSYVVRD
jgi:hypothetical protein